MADGAIHNRTFNTGHGKHSFGGTLGGFEHFDTQTGLLFSSSFLKFKDGGFLRSRVKKQQEVREVRTKEVASLYT